MGHRLGKDSDVLNAWCDAAKMSFIRTRRIHSNASKILQSSKG
jgi:hypothetical protein